MKRTIIFFTSDSQSNEFENHLGSKDKEQEIIHDSENYSIIIYNGEKLLKNADDSEDYAKIVKDILKQNFLSLDVVVLFHTQRNNSKIEETIASEGIRCKSYNLSLDQIGKETDFYKKYYCQLKEFKSNPDRIKIKDVFEKIWSYANPDFESPVLTFKISKKTLFIWDSQNYPQINGKTSCKLVSDSTEIERIISSSLTDYEGVVIHEKAHYNDLEGIYLLIHIRENTNYLKPVFFASTRTADNLLIESQDYRILKMRWHHRVVSLSQEFIDLDFYFSDFLKEELTNYEQKLMRYLYTEPEGFIRMVKHNIHHYKRDDKNLDELKNKVVFDIEKVEKLKKGIGQEIDLSDIKQKVILVNQNGYSDSFQISKKVSKDSSEKIYLYDVIDELQNRLENILIHKQTNKSNEGHRLSWKVLLLDDEYKHDTQLNILINELNNFGVDCVCAQNTDEARKILDDDYSKNGDIRVVVADFLLEEYDNELDDKALQKTQGFDFLLEISEKEYYSSMIGLSNLPRKFLMNTPPLFSIYSKSDNLKDDESILNLINKIIMYGEEMEDSLVYKPTNPSWVKYLSLGYNKYRINKNKVLIEQIITNKVNEHVIYFKKHKKFIGFPFENGAEFMDKKLIPSKEEKRKNLNRRKNKKSESDNYEIKFEKFIKYMVARRLVLHLKTFAESYNMDSIVTLLRDGNQSISMQKQIINTYLCLNLDNILYCSTLEEKIWLGYYNASKVLSGVYKDASTLLNS